MKIILDGSDAVVGTRAMRRYTINMIEQLVNLYPECRFDIFLNFFRGCDDIIDAIIANAKNARKIKYAIPRRISEALWQKVNYPPVDLFTGKADVFHALGDYCPALKSGRYIMTLHGVAYISRPDLLESGYVRHKRSLLKKVVERTQYFVSVSATTKGDFLSVFDSVDPEAVKVIPLGIGTEFKVYPENTVCEALRRKYRIERPYALFVGGLQRHKNIQNIINAFAIIAPKFDDLDLLLVGSQGQPPLDVLDLISEKKIDRRVKILDYVSQEENGLPLLYNGAEMLVFPSLTEGWTSPPLEAMACGTPVITSNISSLPETVGDAAVLIDPLQPDQIGAAMEAFLSDTSLRARMIDRGLTRAANFTWKKCAQATYQFYETILNS